MALSSACAKKEIDRKLDAIVDFAGVERYLDTPVKRYSSGMHVRLGFAVAAHLEPDILIVDEVLAVGDAEFQKKCIGKMQDVSREEGRTVLFVSHNMPAIKSLCSNALLLEQGSIAFAGITNDALRMYLGGDSLHLHYREINAEKNGFTWLNAGIKNTGGIFDDPIKRDAPIELHFSYINLTNEPLLYFNIKIKDEDGNYILVTTSFEASVVLKAGEGKATMIIPACFFNEGNYIFDVMVIGKTNTGYIRLFIETDLLNINIIPEDRGIGNWMGKEPGYIRHIFEWET